MNSKKPFNILLIEKDEVTRDLLEEFLIEMGGQVKVVKDATTAQSLLSGQFDVVILDYSTMINFEIDLNPLNTRSKLIILSSFNRFDQKIPPLNNYFLRKPFNIQDLENLL